MPKWIIALLVVVPLAVGSVARGDGGSFEATPKAPLATRPTTQPSAVDLASTALDKAQHDLQVAKDAAAAARAKCLDDLHATPAVKSLDATVAVDKAALDAARAGGTTQEKLDAGSTYNADRNKVQAAEKAAVSSSQSIAKANAAVVDAAKVVDAKTRELATATSARDAEVAAAYAAAHPSPPPALSPQAAYDQIEPDKTKEKDALEALKRAGWIQDSAPSSFDFAVSNKNIHNVSYSFQCGAHRMSISTENGIVSIKSMD